MAKFTEKHSLNNGLEYIVKDEYGCYIFCDSTPAATYYYATDMDVSEVIAHFSKTTIEREPSTIDGKTYFGIRANANETIYFYYYDNPESVKDKSLTRTDKRHMLSLPSVKYNLTKESL